MLQPVQSSLSVRTRPQGRASVVEIKGRLDTSLDKVLVDEFTRLQRQGVKEIVLDCEGLDYLGSRGVSAFIAVLDELREAGGDLKLARVKPAGAVVLDRLGVSKVVQRFDTIEAAVAAFDTPIGECLTAGGLDVFVAAPQGKVFHASSCSLARRIRTITTFSSKRAGRSAGLRPCRRCC